MYTAHMDRSWTNKDFLFFVRRIQWTVKMNSKWEGEVIRIRLLNTCPTSAATAAATKFATWTFLHYGTIPREELP